jgi:hypothetical protein
LLSLNGLVYVFSLKSIVDEPFSFVNLIYLVYIGHMRVLMRVSMGLALRGGIALAGGGQGSTGVDASDVKVALSAGDLPEARRQALVAVDRALAVSPPCGTVSGLGNPSQFAFPPGEAQRVFIQRYGLVSFFDLRSGRAHQVWSVGLADGPAKNMTATNTFSRYFAKSGQLSIDFQCGKQPTYSGILTLFEVTVPPGITTAGMLSAAGKFSSVLTKEFDTKTQSSGQSRYQQWIIALPDHR